MRPENFLLRHIVHKNRNAQRCGEGDQVCPNMAIGDSAMVGAPVAHDRKDIAEGARYGCNRCEPCCWPGRVRPFIEDGVDIIRKVNAPSAICRTGPSPFTRFRRNMVIGIPPRVLKRVDQPPPRKYSVIPACQVVASIQRWASSSVTSHHGFITGSPSLFCCPVPSSAAGPELMRCKKPSAESPVSS